MINPINIPLPGQKPLWFPDYKRPMPRVFVYEAAEYLANIATTDHLRWWLEGGELEPPHATPPSFDSHTDEDWDEWRRYFVEKLWQWGPMFEGIVPWKAMSPEMRLWLIANYTGPNKPWESHDSRLINPKVAVWVTLVGAAVLLWALMRSNMI